MATQHPALSDGWTRLQLQVPLAIADMFRLAAESEGWGGLKLSGTAAAAIFLALPKEAREAALAYVNEVARKHPQDVSPEGIMERMSQAIDKSRLGTHYVDRILDPELTPKPGAKLSDRGAIAKGLRKGA